MFWIAPSLFALSSTLLCFVLVRILREAEEGYASEYNTDTARQFEDLFLFISSQQLLIVSRILAVMMFTLLFFATGSLTSTSGVITGLVFGILGAVAMLFMPRVLVKVLRIRRLERFNRQLVTALTGMSNALKAGFSIQQAFESVVKEGEAPIGQEFSMFLQQLRVGVSFEEAIEAMDQRMGSEDLTLMIQSIEIARQTGGNLTEVFDRIAETIRERQRIEGKIKSLTAQGKLQGIVVGAMPFLLGFALYIIDPGMMLEFFSSMIGIIVLVFILFLEIMGALIIRKIVNIDV